MDLLQLRYFLSIADSGSITGAARALRVSQPTLTVAIQRLEEQLGTTLLLRGRSGATLTQTGEELLHHAKEVFSVLGRAEERIRGLEKDDTGSFVIGCHESLGAYFLPEMMRDFMSAAPSIELSLWNGTSAAVQEAVLERQVDFGIVVNARPRPSLVIVDMFRDAMDLFVATAHGGHEPGLYEDAVATLKRGPLVFAGRVHQCQVILDRLALAQMLPTRLLSCGDLELVKTFALSSVGVALLPRRVAAYGQEGKLRRLHPGLPFFPDMIAMVYRADIHRTKAAMRLKDALLAHGRALAKSYVE